MHSNTWITRLCFTEVLSYKIQTFESLLLNATNLQGFLITLSECMITVFKYLFAI